MIDVRKDDSAYLRFSVEQQVRFVLGIGLNDCNHLQLHFVSILFVLSDRKMLHGGLQVLLYQVYRAVWQSFRIYKRVEGLKEYHFLFCGTRSANQFVTSFSLVIIGTKILYVHFFCY